MFLLKWSGWCEYYPPAKLIRVNGIGLNKCIEHLIFLRLVPEIFASSRLMRLRWLGVINRKEDKSFNVTVSTTWGYCSHSST